MNRNDVQRQHGFFCVKHNKKMKRKEDYTYSCPECEKIKNREVKNGK